MLENPFTLEEVVRLSKLVRRKREKNRSSTVLWDLELKLFRLERDLIGKAHTKETSDDLYVVTNAANTSALAVDRMGVVSFKTTKALTDLLIFKSVKSAEEYARRSSAAPSYFHVIPLSDWLAKEEKGYFL